MKELLSRQIVRRLIAVALLLVLALVSIFVISKSATDPNHYAHTIASIDEKKAAVTGLTAAAATTATALATIPGDATTPIANQIMQMSSYLLIVVCVLVLEKSLLTVMGYLAFNLLIPAACVLLGIFVFLRKKVLRNLAIKFMVFALVIATIIPFSVRISDLIYAANKATVDQVTTQVAETPNQEDTEEKTWWQNLIDKVKESTTEAAEHAKKLLNSFIDAIALFIIVYCAIPIVVLMVVIWFLKFLFGISIPIPDLKKLPKKDTPQLPKKDEITV